ncbi:zinc finger protein 569-like isoform X2 [Homarus americanus]|nr:zinc finger protein 569-like isoform X2 [Homarus americanus]
MREKIGGKVQLECVICGVMLPSVHDYHQHNIRHHSADQLSRAILKLRNLQVSFNDLPTGDDDWTKGRRMIKVEDEVDDGQEIHLDMTEALGLPLKVDLMDEEVIELGPTDNADHLQVQSRLVKNSQERRQQSRQVIEVKENHPPPCYINPAIEDPDAIVVKFNRELVMAQDSNSRPSVCPEDYPSSSRKNRPINRQMRAVVKTTIEIPNPDAFIMDYRKAMSRSNDKYVMKNVNVMDSPQKKRRGRPRKVPPESSSVYVPATVTRRKAVGGESEFSEEDDEDDLEALADPPLFSDDEDEEASAVIPNITRTRSGRAIKIKKEDGTFKYYDMPGRHQWDMETLSGSNDWDEEAAPPTLVRGRRGRKRKLVNESAAVAPESTGNSDISNSAHVKNSESTLLVDIKRENLDDCSIDNLMKEDLSMPTTDQIVEDSNEFDKSSISETFNGYECFLCFKTFNFKEDCEKHIHEHLRKVVADSSDATVASSSHTFDEKLSDDCDDVNIKDGNNASLLSSKGGETIAINVNEDSVKSEYNSSANLGTQDIKCTGNESFICSVCNEDFHSQTALQEHTHESVCKCDLCGKKYQNRISLQTHIKRYHEDTDWMKFKCATCGKNFGFLTALERHMKEHNPNQKFCCDQCGKVFKSLTNLKNHIPLHTKDEVYECPYCPKRYYIKYSYDKHLRTHLCAPKFHCEVCDKNFSEKKHFAIHLKRHQTGGSLGRSKNFKCNNCGDIKTPTELDIVSEADSGHHKKCLECGKGLYKRFMIENMDTSSLLTKTDKPREQCKICGKFVLNLHRHVKYTHLANEYVPCDACGVVVTKGSLPAHKNRKHGGSAVMCDHCNRVFKNIMCLREHLTKVRRKEDPTKNICKFCKEVVAPDVWKEHMMKHTTKCNDCGASNFPTHEEFMAHIESCRRCSNCGMTDFTSRGDFLAHIEMCGSSIDIMTGTLDSSNDQEVVTSIFAIVDESTCCETCGEVFEDQSSLAHHITEAHPNALSSGHILDQSAMINEAILYACPQDACGVIVASKELLKDHVITVHNLDNFTQ